MFELSALAWKYRWQLLILAVTMVFFFVLMISAVVAAILTVVPMVSDDLIPVYREVADNLTAPDGTRIELTWNTLVALDAVRRNQDFSEVTEASIQQLAGLFIKEVKMAGGQSCSEGEEHCNCFGDICRIEPHIAYERRGLDEVMDLLDFSPDQRQQFWIMAAVDLSVTCTSFKPNPRSTYVWPVDGHVISCFGRRYDLPPDIGEDGMHWGVDIAATPGTPVRAVTAGVVTFAGEAGSYGNLVILAATDGLVTWYGHLDSFAVSAGAPVESGDVIGYVGSTGKSSGAHLHFEARPQGGAPVNPLTLYR